jgi:nitrogen-specific signal transduction histidine kinase
VQDRGYVIRDAQGSAVRMVGAITDITEQQQLEERLRQAQRLESVGQLTGGVAHDFNNLLTVILGSADLLEEELRGEERLRPIAEMIASAAARGAQLTSRLLAFARKQALSPRPVDVNQLVASLEGLLRRTLGEHIEIRIVAARHLRPALVDPGQLESALLNLCVNSRDAMGDGGRLEIATECVAVGEGGREVADLKPGRYVAIRVTDTGSGIAVEHLGRVFEPFFTTKPPGKGTGLGLAMVYGFAKQTGGHVEIASEAGRGTCVTLYLPCADPAMPVAEAGAAVARSEGGTETILLVEDEPLVRKYAVQKLASLGYRVLVASHAAEALDVLGREQEVDLLFTDVVMPGGMSGRQLADEATRRRPGLKVLFTSGYTQDGIVHGGRLDEGVELLAKPYRSSELARRVRAMLDAR